MIIMGMAGKMGSGKDTAANYLVEHHGFTKIAFADNLKNMCMHAFKLSHEDCYGEVGKFRKFDEPVILGYEHLRQISLWVREDFGDNKLTDVLRDKMHKFLGQEFETPRHILQFVGTEILRDIIDGEYHAKVVRMQIDKKKLRKVVISDCRFLNERNAIRYWAGVNVLIVGRTTAQEASEASKGHASENSLGTYEEYDAVIDNTGTLEDLYKNVVAAIKGT
jgi:hypothetical protein